MYVYVYVYSRIRASLHLSETELVLKGLRELDMYWSMERSKRWAVYRRKKEGDGDRLGVYVRKKEKKRCFFRILL